MYDLVNIAIDLICVCRLSKATLLDKDAWIYFSKVWCTHD